MPGKIALTRNFPSLSDLKLVTQEDMRQIGLLTRERIVKRTISGQGVDGPFQPYSADYAAMKRAALGSTGVNLQVSGNMLNHLVIVEITENSVTLGWNQ